MLKTILELFVISLFPIGVSIHLRRYEKQHEGYKKAGLKRKITIGIIFGLLSILGTVFGVESEMGALINIRDAAPICAGLIFNGLSGIIAGFIGGLYRFISVYIPYSSIHITNAGKFLIANTGAYTQIACSLSTLMAGVFAAIVRKYVFDNHHAKWYYALFVGVFCEDFHMLMVFFTHMDDVYQAYKVVEACAIPMILVNSLAVMIASIGVSLVSNEKLIEKTKPLKTATLIQYGLIGLLLFAYLVTSLFTLATIYNINDTSTTSLLQTNIQDVQNDVDSAVARKIEETLNDVNNYYIENSSSKANVLIVEEIKERYSLSEVYMVDKNNNIYASTLADRWFTDGDLDCLISTAYEDDIFIDEFKEDSIDIGTKKKNAGIKNNYGYIQIVYDEDNYHDLLESQVTYSSNNRHVGNSGFLLIVNENGKLISSLDGYSIDKIDVSLIVTNKKMNVNEGDVDYYYYSIYKEGYYIIALTPKDESDQNTNISFLATTLTQIIVFLALYFVIYVMIRKFFVKKVDKLNEDLASISSGNLDLVVDDRGTFEFSMLSDSINKTVDTLKGFIEKEAKKMEEELSFAKDIQHSALPSTFPPYPNHNEFDIFASMQTAKEVGGDFYDFYLIDNDNIAILIADVSGKGVPAAMFMMQSKTIIKSLVTSGLELDDAMTLANSRLCENNDAQMFVTCWIGIVNIKTGHVKYVNAGHNPILIKHNGKYEYLKSKAGFVLAGLDGFKYKLQELNLDKGDSLFLYTDGVTEANNGHDILYGESRLLEVANNHITLDATSFAKAIVNDVIDFENGAVQADDITMLAFDFLGSRNIKDLTVDATIKNVSTITDFVDKFLQDNDVSMKVNTQIDIAIDEIISNIAYYAYNEKIGKVKTSVEIVNDRIILCFEDYGVPYNPLEKEDPDITLSAEDRKIGGLGIFMVKKTMDEITYNNINGRNVLRIIKKIN